MSWQKLTARASGEPPYVFARNSDDVRGTADELGLKWKILTLEVDQAMLTWTRDSLKNTSPR